MENTAKKSYGWREHTYIHKGGSRLNWENLVWSKRAPYAFHLIPFQFSHTIYLHTIQEQH